MYLEMIKTMNLKSHEEVIVRLPETGVVRFQGGNNDGKSIIVDVLKEVVGCTLHMPRVRHPLISYWATCGDIILQRNDGAVLQVHIDKEASRTYYSLMLPGEKAVVRYLADKNLRELVTLFGFHWDEKHQMSLNIYKTFDPLFMVTTTEAANCDILNSVSTDPVAEIAKENLLTEYKLLFSRAKECSSYISNLESKLSLIVLEDEEELDRRSKLAKLLSMQLKALATHEVPDLNPSCDIRSIDALDVESQIELVKSIEHVQVDTWDTIQALETGSIHQVLSREFYRIVPNLEKINLLDFNGFGKIDVTQEFVDYQEKMDMLKEGKCYACGCEFK